MFAAKQLRRSVHVEYAAAVGPPSETRRAAIGNSSDYHRKLVGPPLLFTKNTTNTMTVLRLVFYDSRTIQIKLSGLCTNVADYILTLDEKKSFGETLNFRRRLRDVYIFSVSTTR